MSVGSRPLPPPLVKETACHDPRRLLPAFHPSSLGEAPRASLATRSGCPPLASPSIGLRRRETGSFETGICNLETDARARTFVRARCPSPAPDCRPVARRAVVLLRATHPGKPRRSAPPYGACLTAHQIHLFTRSLAFRGRAGSLEPVRPCHGAKCPPAFAGALRTMTELATFPPGAARFVLRLAERPRVTS